MTATGFEVMREALLGHDTVALLLLFTSATVADDQIFDDPIAVLAHFCFSRQPVLSDSRCSIDE